MAAQPIPKGIARVAALAPWQQALSEARQVAKMVLGRAASVVVAERNSGVYCGVIIGHTSNYIIQQIGRHAAAVIHAKDLFHVQDRGFPWPEVGHVFSIHYSRSRAVAREMRGRVREQGLGR